MREKTSSFPETVISPFSEIRGKLIDMQEINGNLILCLRWYVDCSVILPKNSTFLINNNHEKINLEKNQVLNHWVSIFRAQTEYRVICKGGYQL